MSKATLAMAHLIGQIFRSIFIGQFFKLFVQRSFIRDIMKVTSSAKLRFMKRKEEIALVLQLNLNCDGVGINTSFFFARMKKQLNRGNKIFQILMKNKMYKNEFFNF